MSPIVLWAKSMSNLLPPIERRPMHSVEIGGRSVFVVGVRCRSDPRCASSRPRSHAPRRPPADASNAVRPARAFASSASPPCLAASGANPQAAFSERKLGEASHQDGPAQLLVVRRDLRDLLKRGPRRQVRRGDVILVPAPGPAPGAIFLEGGPSGPNRA